MLRARPLSLAGLLLIRPIVFEDDRGSFHESWNRKRFREDLGLELDFVQDNHSISRRGVIRGLHFQRPPLEQGKLVRVVHGRAFDVAVDIRPDSPTFGRWEAVELCAADHEMIWIPTGFAHGFQALEDDTELLYKITAEYSPEHEGAVRWDDPEVGIDWPLAPPVGGLSAKDAAAPPLRDLDLRDRVGGRGTRPS